MANILILGGGFGGIRAALDLGKKLGRKHSVTLIDKNDSHLFLPSLYEVASARGVEKEDIYQLSLRGTVSVPYGKIFDRRNVNFIQAEVTFVNLKYKEVHLGSGKVLNYNYLVLALGSQVETFGIPGVREYAYQFKSIEDALLIHKKMHQYFQEAAEGKRALPIKYLIGGAGFTGIELAAELACCSEVIRKSCNLKKHCTDISIFEATPQILPMISDNERKIIRKRLEKLGVKIYENSQIEKIEPEGIKIKSSANRGQSEEGQFISGDVIVWTAGIRANYFIESIGGLHLDQRNRVKVNNFLQAADNPEIFMAGDNGVFIDPKTTKPIPGLAYVAIDEGKIIAENIKNHINDKPLKAYKPKYDVWIAPVGGKYAVAHISKNLTVVGFFGWIIREIVDLRYFLTILPAGEAIKLFFREMKIFTKND